MARSTSEQAARRQAKIEEIRRAERASSRRKWSFAAAGGVVAFLAVVAIIAVVVSGAPRSANAGEIIPQKPTGAVTVQQTPERVTDTSGIPGVLAWGGLQNDHVTGPVDYTVTPPVGGPHNPVWMNAGVYDKPIPSERAVHNLEHGAVWITYQSDLAKNDIAALRRFVRAQSIIPEPTVAPGQGNRYIDLSPWPNTDLPSQIVVSSWGHQLRLTSADDPRLQRFIDTFRHSRQYTPEFGAAVDGVPTGTGGVAVTSGAIKANPSGTVD
ncbi:DUF3105 domain-containing protein [Leifsonia poae]|uniref:DUF3105 domain-containing protein n=1 Tax=Leifsonia poae TaxID=110933 RepID=UPI001CC0B02F|nr:DUF3105 domain-containing protein [Leifsonia poae]